MRSKADPTGRHPETQPEPRADARSGISRASGIAPRARGTPRRHAHRASDDIATELLRRRQDGRTGLLHIQGGSVSTSLYLLEGRPVFAVGGHHPDDFGAVLYEEGLLDRDQVMYLLSSVRKGFGRDLGLRMGDVALEMGFLSRVAVREGHRIRTRRKMLACFRFDEPRTTFEPLAHLPAGIPRLPIPLAPIIVEGMARLYDPIRIAQIVDPLRGHYPKLRDTVARVAGHLELDPPEARRLYAFDGQRRVAEILEEDSELGGLLAGLIVLDEIEASTSPQRRPRDIARPATAERVKVSTEAAASVRRSRMDRDGRRAFGSDELPLRSKSNESARALDRAKRLIVDGAFAAAVRELERLEEPHPNLEEVELLLTWSRYRLGWPSRRDDEGLRLKERALAYIERHGFDPFACYALGHLQLAGDDEIQVFEILTEAIAGDPER